METTSTTTWKGRLIVDILVPTGVMAELGRVNSLSRLTRVRSVRQGFVSLEQEEKEFQIAGKPKQSAPALRDHLNQSFDDMMQRFKDKPSTEAASSFHDLQTAEAAVSQVLQANKGLIRAWAQAPNVLKPLRLSMKVASDVGEGLINPAANPLTPGKLYGSLRVRTVTVVLNKTNLNGRTWYVLTAFPDVLRDLGLLPM